MCDMAGAGPFLVGGGERGELGREAGGCLASALVSWFSCAVTCPVHSCPKNRS